MNKNSITISCNDVSVLEEFKNFLIQNETGVCSFVDQRLRSSGYGNTDTMLTFVESENSFELSSKPEDKGMVLVLKDGSVAEIPYKEVDNEEFYVSVKEGRIIVYHKFTESDKVDVVLGSVRDLKSLKEELSNLPERYKEALKKKEESQGEVYPHDEPKAKMEVVNSEDREVVGNGE